jgi:hypothetical protein
VLLKTNTQDEDPYGAAIMSGLLVAINVGVVILFIYQGYLAFKRPPQPTTAKLQKKVRANVVKGLLEKNSARIVDAAQGIGLSKEQAADMQSALQEILVRLPEAIDMM